MRRPISGSALLRRSRAPTSCLELLRAPPGLPWTLGLLGLGVELLAARVAQLLDLVGELLGLVVQALHVGGDVGELLLVVALKAGLADVHEEVGEAEQVVLLPDVVRMAMALGAFQPQAEEGVRDLQRPRHAGRRAALPVQVERLALAVERRGRCAASCSRRRPRRLPCPTPPALRPSRLVAVRMRSTNWS